VNAGVRAACVTGASGFVAAHVVRVLLERGWRVRGTVRGDPDDARHDALRALPGASERLTLHEADLLSEGAFDAVMDGCVGAVHAASPYRLDVEDPRRDLLAPALFGTDNVLRAARATGVGRVVLTSSVAAVTDQPEPERIYDASDWNERSSLTRNPYHFSKVSAERAAWAFAEEAGTAFELVTVNPGLVIGPSIGSGLNASNAIVRSLLDGDYPAVVDLSWVVVDVRDVALVHVEALERPEAQGRYLCGAATVTMPEMVALLRDAGYEAARRLARRDLSGPVGTALARLLALTRPAGTRRYVLTHLGRPLRLDASRVRTELGIEFRPWRETVLDAVTDLRRWGHLQA
jgi:dihydroflavonol-4-reductase